MNQSGGAMRLFRNVLTPVLFAVVALALAQNAAADPIGDFFRRIGRTLSKAHPPADKNKTQKNTRRSGPSRPGEGNAQPPPAQASPSPAQVVSPTATPVPSTTASPVMIRRAFRDPQSAGLRDIPYAVPVPNHPGFVTSPFAPTRGWVDVRGLPSGVEVKDPYTGKTFLTP